MRYAAGQGNGYAVVSAQCFIYHYFSDLAWVENAGISWGLKLNVRSRDYIAVYEYGYRCIGQGKGHASRILYVKYITTIIRYLCRIVYYREVLLYHLRGFLRRCLHAVHKMERLIRQHSHRRRGYEQCYDEEDQFRYCCRSHQDTTSLNIS
ncbi:hypothetical protein [Thermoplasma acidophilum]|uniref:Uncharacterized protein n=1 Tax=Thermoplasma acidophilum (strain ATCC 25905 / DSM 1728 / JCM 9062 / NBRC 15155 / AMRC-C165) TaxID=273075 RepID=Q9HKP0_THEAC|nr:hypothetical protein [Thermoplasma acidophilum]